jgi:hypothetical protein
MKFNQVAPDNDPKTKWHKVFAWFPVTVHSGTDSSTGKEQKVWLEYIWRKRIYSYPNFSRSCFWWYSDKEPPQ